MDGVLTGVIAISGTLAGSSLTYLFGLLATRRTERVAREERLRQERISAYVAFAGAMTELRQSVIAKWFLKQRDDEEKKRAAYTESDKRGAAADHARLRMQMLTDDAELLRLADVTFEPIKELHDSPDVATLRKHEEHSQAVLSAFIQAAGQQVRALPGRPVTP
ncbi:hypothetical protein Amsp01_084540 [Amycolatopsis sp. NBRC 101858]|uniref:hypothetical protein n=1 Tax=Amycolatopsis sp. NBRC 101858 TaxID=3032200 RepID=UPI0024A377BD|nr:hypothetical protein [Amycolatopsis sp. NBRC 101858]GLY42431.1 hypothetical protein Amsp01_084540 [Amycolatopsis sp. NBRC 101858]